MTLAEAIAIAFLAVSGISLLVQSWALHKLRVGRIRGGVYRTAWCRVWCAVLYVLVGTNALTLHLITLQTTFIAFALTQATWQANAWLDVRRGHHPPHIARHRR
jgi:hypothetical protein